MTDDLLTPLALQDLDEIWEYIAVESCSAADRVVAEILRVASRLTTFKQFGSAYNSPVPGIQRFPVVKYPYVIFFFRHRDRIESCQSASLPQGAIDVRPEVEPWRGSAGLIGTTLR